MRYTFYYLLSKNRLNLWAGMEAGPYAVIEKNAERE
jgi:hypothetical protein